MNQILSVETPKKQNKVKNNKGPVEIGVILKFFIISIIIFGMCMVASGSYSMYENFKIANSQTKPTIHLQDISANQTSLQISHNKNLQEVRYTWNDEDETKIECTGKKKVEQTIEIPTGENILTIYAVDIEGKETVYEKGYTLQGDITIDITAEGNNIKISAEGKSQLSYLTYRWDEEEETKIDAEGSQIEETIEIIKGEHTLTVIAVDINNKTEKKKQSVKGVTKPKLDVTTDGSGNFVIKASDEEGIKKIEFSIDGDENKKVINADKVLPLERRKEIKYKYPLHDGENKVEVTVYNESDISEDVNVTLTK